MTWTAATPNGAAVTDYIIEYQPRLSGHWSRFSDGTSPSPSTVVVGLTNGTEYEFRVSAVNSVGIGPTSSTEPATPKSAPPLLYPASVHGRHFLDQNGDVYLMRTMSTWSMGQNLSNAEITTALTGVSRNGFNAVTVWFGGGYDLTGSWAHVYENESGDNFWSGTPWASSLSTGFDTFDWIVSEADRLGLVVNLSLPGGYGSTGAKSDWASVSDAQMKAAGEAFATRYAGYDNIVWHVMLDDADSTEETIGQRVNAFFEGVNSIEGASRRPFRWIEVANGSTTQEQGWLGTTAFNATIDCIYSYDDDSVVQMERVWSESSGPVGDCEPPYVGAPHYGGNERQQLRERSWSVFLEGGSLINFGHEDWWSFGQPGLYTDGLTWDEVQADESLVDQSHIWSTIDSFVADTAWAPDAGSFVTTGAGSGDTRVAAGLSSRAAIAYFATPRAIRVDTTTLVGASTVRLRWFDPTNGSYTLIAAQEAVSSGRPVSYPGANAGGQNDWVLVVDTVTPAVTQ